MVFHVSFIELFGEVDNPSINFCLILLPIVLLTFLMTVTETISLCLILSLNIDAKHPTIAIVR
jgi:hypothetical protein